ncbi:MAG TPA: hypothetical protein VJ625_17180 [Propionibacteriaceae bacterium]|nr:hypothetical protein [Propionibacteriaceae bacterium]
MELTQEDYEARKQRVNDAVASDEDRRLVKEYERQGFVEARLAEEPERREKPAQQLVPADPITGRALVGQWDQPPAEQGDAAGDSDWLDVPALVRPASSANKPEWITFADLVNQQRDRDNEERPIDNPADPKVTKDQLIDAYGQFGEPAD